MNSQKAVCDNRKSFQIRLKDLKIDLENTEFVDFSYLTLSSIEFFVKVPKALSFSKILIWRCWFLVKPGVELFNK